MLPLEGPHNTIRGSYTKLVQGMETLNGNDVVQFRLQPLPHGYVSKCETIAEPPYNEGHISEKENLENNALERRRDGENSL